MKILRFIFDYLFCDHRFVVVGFNGEYARHCPKCDQCRLL